MSQTKLKIGVLFGGASTEHEISIITALQVLGNIDNSKFEAIPIYITKDGVWIKGDARFREPAFYKDLEAVANKGKKSFISPDTMFQGLVTNPKSFRLFKRLLIEEIAVVFPCFHGSFGEDGSVQGLLELAGIPYVGCGVLASSIGMDKISSKGVFKNEGIPIVSDFYFTKEEFEKDKKGMLAAVEKKLSYPLFVKPSNSGSTIGIGRAENIKELENAINVASFYDTRILVEEAVGNAKEVNISVLGYGLGVRLSETEQPVSTGQFLSFQDKYINQKGKSAGMAGAKRIIPAPIKAGTKKIIEDYAGKVFRALDCSGVVRIDFLLTQDEKKIYINEINTLPGSMSFYLWRPKGVSFKSLISKLIEIALKRHKARQRIVRTFRTNVLESFSGIKAAKT